MKMLKTKGAIYLISVLLVTILGISIIHHSDLPRNYYRYTVAIPGVVALLFLFSARLSDISISEFFQQFLIPVKSIKWLILSSITYSLLAYWASGTAALVFGGNFVLIPNFQIPLSRVYIIFVLAFFEEIGWRGFGLPHLMKKHGFILSSLVVGVIWALWHLPGYLVNFGAPNDIPFIVFSIWVVAASFIFTWLYVKSSNNIWTAILLHFGANMALQLYPIMPVPAGTSATFYIMTISVLLVAIALFKKYSKKQVEIK
ncbi:MAG: type II CAAX endopeptidase family protein [Cyclobacteriaceae bacterium]|uniref:type II CAAX endopeptidase family protein n=1 Tax=Fulvivirga sp. TaxID=1931237 RepID=UPI0032ED8CEF